jgi:hypothetical protein
MVQWETTHKGSNPIAGKKALEKPLAISKLQEKKLAASKSSAPPTAGKKALKRNKKR